MPVFTEYHPVAGPRHSRSAGGIRYFRRRQMASEILRKCEISGDVLAIFKSAGGGACAFCDRALAGGGSAIFLPQSRPQESTKVGR